MTDSNGTPLQTGDWVRPKDGKRGAYQVFITNGLLYLTGGGTWLKSNGTARAYQPAELQGRKDVLGPLTASSMLSSNWVKCVEPGKATLEVQPDQTIVARVPDGSFEFKYDRPTIDPPMYNRTGYAGPIDPSPKQ